MIINDKQKSSIYQTYTFFGILLLALILRLIWVYFIPVYPISDSAMYDVFAQSISQGNGYSYPNGVLTAYWPVGTSAIYGFLYYMFGQSFTVIVVFNLIVALLTTALIMLIADKWFNQKTAIIAGIIYVFWPSQIQFTSVLASELLFNLFMLAGLYFWPHKLSSKYLPLIIAGIFFAFATYIRPIAVLIPFILIATSFINQPKFWLHFKIFICVSLTMIVVISPWSYRNYQLFDSFVLISTNGAPVLWMGNNPESNGEYMPLPDIEFSNEVERSSYFKQQAIDHIKSEPMLFLQRFSKRFVDYYKSETIGVHWNKTGITKALGENWLTPLKVQSTIYWTVILILALYGAYKILTNQREKRVYLTNPAFILITYFTVLHCIIASGDRYHFPIIPFLAIFSAYTLSLFNNDDRKNKDDPVP